MLASRIVDAGLSQNTAEAFGNFIETFFAELAEEVEKGAKSTQRELLEYQEAISYGSTGGESIRTRLRILTRRLVTRYPEFAPLLGDVLEHQNATENALRDQAEVIASLLYRVNEQHAAQHGDDIFKTTNDAVAALHKIGVPINDAQQYGELIDVLYVLFYEGSGACRR
jgi:hypothetical protein